MPKPFLLPRLIRLVKADERKKYEKWIEMQCVDMKTLHIQWFKTLYQKLEELDFPDKADFSEVNSWWNIRFPEHQENRMIERLNRDLCRFTEEFFVYQLQDIYSDRKQVDLLFALSRRGAFHLFVKYANREFKRYRTLARIKLDFRYWLNFHQLLLVAMEWQSYHAGHKKIRGYKPISLEELNYTLENTLISYSLERGLFKTQTGHPLNKIELQILEQVKINPTQHTQVLLNLNDWARRKEVPSREEVAHGIDHLFSAINFSSNDFAENVLTLFHNRLAIWERLENRHDLVQQKIRVYKKILSQQSIIFSPGHFFNLVKLYSELIGYVNRRISLTPSDIRQDQILPYVKAAKEDLERQVLKLPIAQQAEAIRLMSLHLSFELDEKAELAKKIRDWFTSPAGNPLYEAAARWLKAKFLMMDGEEDTLFSHTKALESFLQTNTRPPNLFTYLNHMKVSCRYIRRISSVVNKQKSTEKLEKELLQEQFIHDRSWLHDVILKYKE